MLQEEEIKPSDRALLGARGKVTLPAGAVLTNCRKNRWAGYELTYVEPHLDGVFDEIEKDRKKCSGFFRYEPGFTPIQHLERQEQKRRERLQYKIVIFSLVAGAVGGIVSSLLRSFASTAWRWIERHL